MKHFDILWYTAIFLTTTAGLACDAGRDAAQSSDGELHLAYPEPEAPGGNTNGGEPPYDMCHFTGPNETIAVVSLTSEFERQFYHGCDLDREFRWGHYLADVSVIRQSGPTSLPTSAFTTLWPFLGYTFDTTADVGAEFVVSLRRAGTDWIVTGAVAVATSSDTDPINDATSDREVRLPERWTELKDDATTTRSTFFSTCPDGANPDGHKAMTDDEFDTYAHTAERTEPCEPEPDAGSDAGGLVLVGGG